MNVNLDFVTTKDFHSTTLKYQNDINELKKKIVQIHAGCKQLEKRVDSNSEDLIAEFDAKINKRFETIKKQYGYIVDELLSLDSSQKLNYSKFMTKLTQLD